MSGELSIRAIKKGNKADENETRLLNIRVLRQEFPPHTTNNRKLVLHVASVNSVAHLVEAAGVEIMRQENNFFVIVRDK
jgi:hypothetical protein